MGATEWVQGKEPKENKSSQFEAHDLDATRDVKTKSWTSKWQSCSPWEEHKGNYLNK